MNATVWAVNVLADLASLVAEAGPLFVLALVAAAGVAVGLAVYAVLGVLGRLTARTQAATDDELARRMPLPLAILAGTVGAGAALTAAGTRIQANHAATLRGILVVTFVVAAAWGLVRAVRVVLETTGRRKPRVLPATRVGGRLIAVLVYTAAFLTILAEYGISITPVLTGLGIAGLAVALALQDTLANFFAGLWIQTGQPLQPGHYIRLEEEKLEGYVEQVGWRTTRLRTLGGNLIVIPNSKLAQDVVTDHNLPTPDLSVTMEFRTAYEADPAHVCTILVEETQAAMQGNDSFQPGSEPFAQLAGLDEYALRFQLIFRAREFVAQYAPQAEIRTRVLARFRKENIRIPYPTRHNLQESVAGPAHRVPSAPGGFSPQTRPPRPREIAQAPPQDPRELEAEAAKADIAAQQEAKAAEAAANGEAPASPEPVKDPGSPARIEGVAGAPTDAADASTDHDETGDHRGGPRPKANAARTRTSVGAVVGAAALPQSPAAEPQAPSSASGDTATGDGTPKDAP